MGKPGLRLHPADNVAVALAELSPGMIAVAGGLRIRVRERIPFGHKFALERIPKGGQVVKYGHTIGHATRSIEVGSHVHVHNLISGGTGRMLPVCADVLPPPRSPSIDRPPCATFLGFRRADGRVGVRNHILVLPTVHCVNGVVELIAREVPEVLAVPHIYGCSHLGNDSVRVRQVLESYAGHPNVGTCLLVGLGCETMSAAEIADALCKQGAIVECLVVQDEGGTRAAVKRGVDIVRKFLRRVGELQREPIPVSELVIGVECGGSDALSGISANPAVGVASDLLVSQGGTVIMSEVTEWIGAEDILVKRAASQLVGRRIVEAIERRVCAAKELGVDIRASQLAPGNIAGGLTTLEEKSLGAIAKGGTSHVSDFLAYGERPAARGLVLMDTPGNDLESVTAMVAGGAQIILFTTGRGTPIGNPIAPVIKIASNKAVYNRLEDDLDFCAGGVIKGEPVFVVGQHIFELLLEVASGAPTAAERWGYRQFAIELRGPRA